MARQAAPNCAGSPQASSPAIPADARSRREACGLNINPNLSRSDGNAQKTVPSAEQLAEGLVSEHRQMPAMKAREKP
jgi:hypothetical protein